MLGLQVNPKKVLSKLQEFENFCLGKKRLTPEEFKALNIELSMGSVFHIGKRRFLKELDGKHLTGISVSSVINVHFWPNEE